MEAESKAACTYLIRSMEEKFSAKERRVADYILADPAKAIHPSMETLAEHIGVSVSTLVRFVRKLGYEGYQQFRIALAAEALTPNARMFDTEVHPDDDPVSIAFRSAARSLTLTESMIDRKELGKVAASIIAAGCVHLYGLGGSAIVAKDACHKIMRTGIRCLFAEDFHMQLMLASQMRQGEVAILISHTGANKDILAIADTARKAGAQLCALTTYPRSTLSRMADMRFISAISEATVISEAFSARIAQLAIIDALYIQIMETLGASGMEHVERMRSAIAGRRL